MPVTHQGNRERVVKAAAGTTFSVVLTDTGKGGLQRLYSVYHALTSPSVFTFGSAANGQLGNGTTGERIVTGNKTAYDIETKPSTFSFTFAE